MNNMDKEQNKERLKQILDDKISALKYYPINNLCVPEYYCRTAIAGHEKLLPASITRFGYLDPILINKRDNKLYVIDGTKRVECFKNKNKLFISGILISVPLNIEKEIHYILNEKVNWNNSDTILEFLSCAPSFFGLPDLSSEDFDESPKDNSVSKNAGNHQYREIRFGFSKTKKVEILESITQLKKDFKENKMSNVLIHLINYYNETNGTKTQNIGLE